MTMEDNPYLSGAELMDMVEKQKIVEEMAQAAAEAEASVKEQVKKAELEKKKQQLYRDSLLLLGEEDRNDFNAKLQKKISEDQLNQDTEENMLQARLANVELSNELPMVEEIKDEI